jgi:phenylalanyl-tRNA synthetase alpha chain
MTRLPELEYRVLGAILPGETLEFKELQLRVGDPARVPDKDYRLKLTLGAMRATSAGVTPTSEQFDQAKVMAGVKLLADRGLVAVTETEDFDLAVADDDAAMGCLGELPERAALVEIDKRGGTVAVRDLPEMLGQSDVRSVLKWLLRKGWCRRDADTLTIADAGRRALGDDGQGPDEVLALYLVPSSGENRGPQRASELEGRVDVKAALEMLRGRDDIIRIKKRVMRSIALTEAGAGLRSGGIEPVFDVTQLTPELLASGDWQKVRFRPYDVTLATVGRFPGKAHPLQRVIGEIRRSFFEMGFEEVASPMVDTAFWVFDALFQPQDHPAREMQDTFYMAVPERGRLPADDVVDRVARTHEDGGDTGSTGWRCKWDRKVAEKLVLRTHTTSATIRALAQNPNPPRKVFCIGKTFRHENVDQTHLPEFMQIDGVIIDERATFAALLGTLEAFYKKMGASEVRFRPSFFPYTEPSAEVFARMGSLGWVEMCGAGVFRPEVTRPLGCRVPVLAWGGGVERIAMLRFGIQDIRQLYWSDIDWLKGAGLSR